MYNYHYLDAKNETRAVTLVQRVKAKGYDDGRTGVDAHFSMDYMGSAEFEYGALPKSLKAMRAAKLGKSKPVLIKVHASEVNNPLAKEHKHFRAYYLGPDEFLPQVREFFRLELEGMDGPNRIRMKERSDISKAYGLDEWSKKRGFDSDVIGWWDIGNHWAMFKSETDANKFRDALAKGKK